MYNSGPNFTIAPSAGAVALIISVAAWGLSGGLCAPTEDGHHLKLAACEGDKFYLPCLGDDDIVVWKIKELSYLVDRLPPWVNVNVNGLTVSYTTEEAEGFYSCYAYNNVTHTLEEISTISLDVRIRASIRNNSLKDESRIVNGTMQMNNEQEMNLIVSENDVLYIPCKPIVGTNQVVVWEIDGLTYLDTRLPRTHVQHYGGIIVSNASAEFLGSTYRCFSFTDLNPMELFTVHMTLVNANDPTTIPQLDLQSGTSEISMSMVLRDLSFQTSQKIFSFTLEEECQHCSCARGRETYFVQAQKRGSFQPPTWERATNRTVKIPSGIYQDEDVFTEVSSTGTDFYRCSNLSYVFRVEPDEVTKEQCASVGQKSCIQLKEYLQENLLIVSWPQGPHSDLDCSCPVVLHSSHSNTPKFEDCYCYNLTAYQVRLNGTELCWENLNQTTNDTKVLLAEVVLQSEYGSTRLRLIRTLRRFITQGPDQFPPNVTQFANTSNFCIDAKSTADWSPVVKTEIIATDITFDVVLNITRSDSYSCETFNFFKSCSPLKYIVTAYTLCTQSPSTEFIGYSNGSGNVCDCLNMKANLTTNITDIKKKSISVRVGINCLNLWPYDIHLSNLFIQANATVVNHTQIVQLNVTCDKKSTDVIIPDLKPGTDYVVSAVWISPLTQKPECILTNAKGISTTKDLTITIVASSAGVVVFLACLIFGMLIIVKKRRARNSWVPENDEEKRLNSSKN